MVRQLLAAVACALLVALPRIAQACPACAAGDDAPGKTARTVVLAGFIVTPFVVAGIVLYVIRRTLRGAAKSSQAQIDE